MGSVKYYLTPDNAFVIENYNQAPTFSSFFPGIAGVFGCPMWVFYANRGQCITSAGVQDKDNSIIEFQSANKAYRYAALNSFRTFIKVNGQYYEPFAETSPQPNTMRIQPGNLTLIEENKQLKIRITVNYFTLANEILPGLARSVTITNLANRPQNIEIIDGLPAIIPYGFSNDLLKRMSQTIAAWSVVEDFKTHFYKLKVAPADCAETNCLDQGNFYLAFCRQSGQDRPVDVIVDPNIVFGEQKSWERPASFLAVKNFRVPTNQQTEGFIPSAFCYKKIKLAGQGEAKICSIIGQADNPSQLKKFQARARRHDYFLRKAKENDRIIDDISAMMGTESASQSFDLYCRQNFLDNVMRGGLPVTLDHKVLYLFYRKHGDMERDYNDFKLMPSYFSQGNGNYRDINQNRRNDIFFNPRVAADNIYRFFNLIQLDGFNPLIVLGSQFFIRSAAVAENLAKQHFVNPPPDLVPLLTKPFVLGNILKRLDFAGCAYQTSALDFATALMEKSVSKEEAAHGEGYWTDHFTYNTDLLESFACLYPEQVKALLFIDKEFTFYDSEYIVVERKHKYRLIGDKVRQYGSVKLDPEKAELLSRRSWERNAVRTENGQGAIYKTTLLGKIICLLVNKTASFDPCGIGIEMEAEKPNWYDALNGLPGLLGSSLSETLEIKRLCNYLLDQIDESITVTLPIEVAAFLEKLVAVLMNNRQNNFRYWDDSCRLKEDFRRATRLGITGEEKIIDNATLRSFIQQLQQKCTEAVRQCRERYGNYYTYFINELVEYEHANSHGIKAKRFEQKPLPLFLEGFVHALRVDHDKQIPKLVKQSPLYDRKLKMYKVNAPLPDAPIEIGRAKVFAPGWLENESVWLHMEYKYLLELLKTGCYEEFFGDLKNVLVPFLKPATYRRSILENSSFIVSSCNSNRQNHGRGFVARLSGATAEFIDIWLLMTTGKNIFYTDHSGQLCFKLAPILPKWLFKNGQFSFKLLGNIDVTYLNPQKKNTYEGLAPVTYKLIIDGKTVEINQPFIPAPIALQIRERKVKEICCHLA
ncbi:hypothetical protein HZB07_01535 [Candidatus Saganbacteria bacterium]|nr:hypothetical protein [Candidatus Saganbacteria bacterium]